MGSIKLDIYVSFGEKGGGTVRKPSKIKTIIIK